ncbi:MAG: hypothetical protein K8H84_12380 [Sulfuricella denitrificans]|nr:hypothetical protein [Sulfuricella denitrificans]
MKLQDIRTFTYNAQPKPNVDQKTILIRKIQVLRGDDPCFASDKSQDCAEICQWRRDCRKLKAVWQR